MGSFITWVAQIPCFIDIWIFWWFKLLIIKYRVLFNLSLFVSLGVPTRPQKCTCSSAAEWLVSSFDLPLGLTTKHFRYFTFRKGTCNSWIKIYTEVEMLNKRQCSITTLRMFHFFTSDILIKTTGQVGPVVDYPDLLCAPRRVWNVTLSPATCRVDPPCFPIFLVFFPCISPSMLLHPIFRFI